MKIMVVCFQVTYHNLNKELADAALGIFSNVNLRLVFTIIVFPCCMNVFQFIVQDVILRKKEFGTTDEAILREFFIVDENFLDKHRAKVSGGNSVD